MNSNSKEQLLWKRIDQIQEYSNEQLINEIFNQATSGLLASRRNDFHLLETELRARLKGWLECNTK